MDIPPSIPRILGKLKFAPIMFLGIAVGYYLEKEVNENCARFRGKSKLYGRPEHETQPPWR